jgi:alpha-L-fucosidase 2
MNFSRRGFVRLAAAVAANLGIRGRGSFAQEAAPLDTGAVDAGSTMWLEQPSKVWMDAYPVGNGRLGAMVFGGVESERLALNEDTLWSGFPRDCTNPDALKHLATVRKLVLQDKDYQAADLECLKMQGPWNEAYEPLGDLLMDLEHAGLEHAGTPTAYRRTLDLDAAVATVEYRVGEVAYRREVFASSPDDAIVMRLTASKPGALTGRLRFTSLLRANASAEGRELVLAGKAPERSLPGYVPAEPTVSYSTVPGAGMHFAGVAVADATGGTVQAQPDGSLRVTGASSVTVTIGAATGFRNFATAPDIPLEQVVAKARSAAVKAAAKPYEKLLEAHRADHRKLYRRVSLELGVGGGANADALRPTDQRVEAFASNADPSLAVLLFNFGRYLLIASSREGSQAANLQGIWNAELLPPWSCNWTTNINVQMNYWQAETCNLSELHRPLLGLVQDLSVTGAKVAEVNYGAPGWCVHHNVDLWRQAAPVGDGQAWTKPTWTAWGMAGQWLCAHLWDHYTFTQDKAYLREVAYPVMKGSAEFCVGWLIDDGKGGLTTCPSVSPENEFIAPNGKTADVSAGTTMDMALIREIFAHCVEASTILGVDGDWRAKLVALTERLPPYGIDAEGRLLEWGPGLVGTNLGTGHSSPLYPLYPGTEMSPRRTPELASAARKLLEQRREYHLKQSKSPEAGWPGAWHSLLWARLGDGESAWELVQAQINHDANCNLLNDCFDTHPPELKGARKPTPGVLFQIDGNLGSTAAMAEMLVQSHDGEIAFLPAIPAAWTRGKVSGLRARGGLEVGVEWASATASVATVRAAVDGTQRFRGPKGQVLRGIARNGVDGSLPANEGGAFAVACRAGETCRLTFRS